MFPIYSFDSDSPQDVAQHLAERITRRRLDRNWSRNALSQYSGVPIPTITKFEQTGKISLISFICIMQALCLDKEIDNMARESKFTTLEELNEINKNKTRQRGTGK